MDEIRWSDEEDGQFINLRALSDFRTGRGEGALLPDWETIRQSAPQLIHPADAPGERYFVTHRWDDPRHPDPTGWQFSALDKLASHYNYRDRNIALWYDYMSLPQQRPRGGEKGRIFRAGLNNIRRTVGRCQVFCLISQQDDDNAGALDAMLHRGWIVFELYIARSQMKRPLPLYQRQPAMIDYGRAQHDWDAVAPDIQALAPTDTPNLLHRWLEKRRIVCTSGGDLKFLAGLLHEELSAHDQYGRIKPVPYDVQITLSYEELRPYAFLNVSGQSRRFSDLFLDPGARYDPRTGLWTVIFRRRPQLPPWGSAFRIDPDDLAAWRIDPADGTSPMYRGIRFEIDGAGCAVSYDVV